jgi:hypothetical protein
LLATAPTRLPSAVRHTTTVSTGTPTMSTVSWKSAATSVPSAEIAGSAPPSSKPATPYSLSGAPRRMAMVAPAPADGAVGLAAPPQAARAPRVAQARTVGRMERRGEVVRVMAGTTHDSAG